MKISFIGDIALNGGYADLVRDASSYTLAESIRTLLNGSDLVIGNLEGPLTDREPVGPSWRFNLHGDPQYACVLRSAGIDVVSLANNHAMDHGWEGLSDTQRALEAAGIQYLGAGKNLGEARKPLFVKVNGTTVGILACCDVPSRSWLYAEDTKPGVAPLNRALLFEDIAKAKEKCDCLILCIHWGQENIGAPAPRYRRLARSLVKAGVNVVVGHHPHVLQGIEMFRAGVVAYSLGNFTFSNEIWLGKNQNGDSFSLPYKLTENNRESAVWKVTVSKTSAYEQCLIPVYLGENLLPISDHRPVRLAKATANDAALTARAYALVWSMRMFGSRFKVIFEGLGGARGLAKRLTRLRPRHIHDVWRLLAREWEQFKGTE